MLVYFLGYYVLNNFFFKKYILIITHKFLLRSDVNILNKLLKTYKAYQPKNTLTLRSSTLYLAQQLSKDEKSRVICLLGIKLIINGKNFGKV
jgi:hypothetical protein